MTDQTESASEQPVRVADELPSLLAALDDMAAGSVYHSTSARAAAAIRALEAKAAAAEAAVRELEEWKAANLEWMAISASMTPGRELMEMQAENREQREALENACNLAAHTHNTLANLLARIHRDGGHYMTQHGAEKAAEDADQIVAELFADRDRLAEALAVEQRIARGWQETAEKFRGERDGLAGEVERLTHRLAEQIAQNSDSAYARLTSELAAAREDAEKWEQYANTIHEDAERMTFMTFHRHDGLDGQTVRNWVDQRSLRMTYRGAIDAARRAGEGEK